jgi:hypothetical protein
MLSLVMLSLVKPSLIIPSLIGRAQNSADRRAPDPVSRAFIGNSEAPTSGTSRSSLSIAPIRDRTCPGDDDHARPRAKSRRQRDLHIADNLDFAGNHFRNQPPHSLCNFPMPGSRGANAYTQHLLRIYLRRAARLAYGLLQSFASACFTHARDVAGTGSRRCEDDSFVPHSARCLASPAIDAKIVGHALVLSQCQIELSRVRHAESTKYKATSSLRRP